MNPGTLAHFIVKSWMHPYDPADPRCEFLLGARQLLPTKSDHGALVLVLSEPPFGTFLQKMQYVLAIVDERLYWIRWNDVAVLLDGDQEIAEKQYARWGKREVP